MDIAFIESLLWVIIKISMAVILIVLSEEEEILMVLERQVSPKGLPAKQVAPKEKSPEKEKRVISEQSGTRKFEGTQIIQGQTIARGNLVKEQKEQDKKRIGNILLQHNLITKDILDRALEHQNLHGGSLTQYLLHYGYIDEKQLAYCLCSQFRVPYLPLASYDISEDIIQLIPTDIAEKYWVLPVEKQGNALTVVMIDPLDTKLINELETLTGLTIIPFVGIISEIASALQTYYKLFIKDKAERMPPFFIDTKTYIGKERRNSIRYLARIDVQFPAQGYYVKSQTVDVSRDGFALRSERSIPVGTVITLEINLPQEISAFPIAVVGQIARCSSKENDQFELGFKTLKISREEVGSIINYVTTQAEGTIE